MGRMTRIPVCLGLAVLLAGCENDPPFGVLDLDFGQGGYAVHSNAAGGAGHDLGRSVAIDDQGRILVTGSSYGFCSDDCLPEWTTVDGWNSEFMAVWRYESDGTLDTSFGGTGYVVYSARRSRGQALTTDSDGNILITGYLYDADTTTYDLRMTVWRIEPNGEFDASFGEGGLVTMPPGNGSAVGKDLGVDGSGRIVVAGKSKPLGGKSKMTLWRLEPDGSLDLTFGSYGVVVFSHSESGTGYGSAQSLVLDATGRIVVVGFAHNDESETDDMTVLRYLSSGILDDSFGDAGVVRHHNAGGGKGDDEGRSVALDAIGRILIVGNSKSFFGGYEAIVWRLMWDDGSLDTTLSGRGYRTLRKKDHDSLYGAEAVFSDGLFRITVAGAGRIWRMDADGMRDSSFGGGWGHVDLDADEGNVVHDIVKDSQDRVIAVGTTEGPTGWSDLMIWAFD